MNLQDLLLAYAISQGSHTAGHFKSANELNVPISVNGTTETWRTPDKRKDAEINSAGFSSQDLLKRALEGTDTQKNVSLTNAVLKGAYLAGLPNLMSGQIQQGGDIGGMERSSGNKMVKELVALSGLVDLYSAINPNKNWNVDFIAPDGAPGLALNLRF